jgi:asparagine synthase (glutamine-hydrolysing)
MCGIAGVISRRVDKRAPVERMVARLVHRGPDSASFWGEGIYRAGMRRLSILDIANGNQPLFDTAGRVVLFYNGEIYNSPQLRVGLEKEGYTFRTGSDGEVICHLYTKYGRACFEHLDGQFAIALWDDEHQTLLLARDSLGEKPLYYSRIPQGGVAFSSEIPSLLSSNLMSNELDRQSLWDFPSFLWVPEPATIYTEIRALPPGQVMVVSDGCVDLFQFSPILESRDLIGLSDRDISEIVKDTVTRAVTSRLLSDVPVGAFLSGGLDSSIVCSIAAREVPKLHTFCVGFEQVADPYHGFSDESLQAEAFAKQLGTIHTSVRVTSNSFRQLLPQFLQAAGQPYAVSSGLGVLAVAREAAAQSIKVLLAGDGADEAFGGYSWYPHIPKTFTGAPSTPTAERFLDGDQSTDERIARLAGYEPKLRAWAWHYYASEAEKEGLFNADFRSETSLRWFADQRFNDPIDFIRQDRQFYFPNEMLSKLDRMTMAYSVEGRAPFAAPFVFKLAAQLPWDQLVRGGQLKWLLRNAFASDLPRDITQRPKHGFNVPIDHWLRGDWQDLFEDTFSADSVLSRQGIISSKSYDYAKSLLANPRKITGHVLFAFIMLNQWMTLNEN